MWAKIVTMVLGVLGEFLVQLLRRAKDKDLANVLAEKARNHAIGLMDSTVPNDEKFKYLVTFVKEDAQTLGKAVKDNFVNVIAELAVAAAKEEIAKRV